MKIKRSRWEQLFCWHIWVCTDIMGAYGGWHTCEKCRKEAHIDLSYWVLKWVGKIKD